MRLQNQAGARCQAQYLANRGASFGVRCLEQIAEVADDKVCCGQNLGSPADAVQVETQVCSKRTGRGSGDKGDFAYESLGLIRRHAAPATDAGERRTVLCSGTRYIAHRCDCRRLHACCSSEGIDMPAAVRSEA